MAELITSEKSGRRSSLQKLPPRIDLTAMVDLAFLLITFFMLTTSLAKPHVMQVAMPVKDTAPAGDPASQTMTLCLGKNNQVLWYMGMAEKPITPPTLVRFDKLGLRSTLINMQKKIFAAFGKPLIVILKPSAHAVYADFVSALDELNIANVQSYAIADISSKDIAFLTQQKAY
jgi:biopolymer transport protein ExbD